MQVHAVLVYSFIEFCSCVECLLIHSCYSMVSRYISAVSLLWPQVGLKTILSVCGWNSCSCGLTECANILSYRTLKFLYIFCPAPMTRYFAYCNPNALAILSLFRDSCIITLSPFFEHNKTYCLSILEMNLGWLHIPGHCFMSVKQSDNSRLDCVHTEHCLMRTFLYRLSINAHWIYSAVFIIAVFNVNIPDMFIIVTVPL